jgi:hypothetical protein
LAIAHCEVYVGSPITTPPLGQGRCQRRDEQQPLPSDWLLVLAPNVPRDLEHGSWEGQLVLGGRDSRQRDLAERRWRVHGAHQERQVVRRVHRLESRHLARQPMVHERARECDGETAGVLESVHDGLEDLVQLLAVEHVPLHLVGQGRHQHRTDDKQRYLVRHGPAPQQLRLRFRQLHAHSVYRCVVPVRHNIHA